MPRSPNRRTADAAYYAKNRGRKIICDLNNDYGLSIVQYLAMIHFSDNRCSICKTEHPFPTLPNRRWSVDHDHRTGKIRGILCSTCNKALGLLKDDLVLLNKAEHYLKLYAQQDRS